MPAEDALAVIAEYRGGAGDNSFAALAAIEGALQPPFTTKNAARRRLLLRAAFSLLDKENAARVLQVLTKPEGAAQKSLRDRFERLDRSLRRPLLDMLREPRRRRPRKRRRRQRRRRDHPPRGSRWAKGSTPIS